MRVPTLFLLSAFFALLHTRAAAAENPGSIEFFEKKIRPVLADNCYKCHSVRAQKLKGKFLLDSRASLLKGGETGPAIVLGDAEKSLLIQAVRYKNPDIEMPPDTKLPDAIADDLAAWIKAGAKWPDEPAPQPLAV